MKVVCINNEQINWYPPCDNLIVGKIYEIYEDSDGLYNIKNDPSFSNKQGFLKERFKLLLDVREEKLNELGI